MTSQPEPTPAAIDRAGRGRPPARLAINRRSFAVSGLRRIHFTPRRVAHFGPR
jgi:hypothetical protein